MGSLFYPTDEYNKDNIAQALLGEMTTTEEVNKYGDRWNIDAIKYISYDSGLYMLHMDDGMIIPISTDNMVALGELLDDTSMGVGDSLEDLNNGLFAGTTDEDGNVDTSQTLLYKIKTTLESITEDDEATTNAIIDSIIGKSNSINSILKESLSNLGSDLKKVVSALKNDSESTIVGALNSIKK